MNADFDCDEEIYRYKAICLMCTLSESIVFKIDFLYRIFFIINFIIIIINIIITLR